MEEILKKFKNGEERFQTDPVFHKCIMALAQGADPITILDYVLRINLETIEKYKELVEKGPTPIIIKPD